MDDERDLAMHPVCLDFSIFDDGPVVVDVDILDVVDGFGGLSEDLFGGVFQRVSLGENFDRLGYGHGRSRVG